MSKKGNSDMYIVYSMNPSEYVTVHVHAYSILFETLLVNTVYITIHTVHIHVHKILYESILHHSKKPL